MRGTTKHTDMRQDRSAAPSIPPRPPLQAAEPPGAFALDPLPYGESALAPAISADTLAMHYGKHHAGYIANLNTLVRDLPQLAQLDLTALVKTASGDERLRPLFNNAGQAWNHAFYWRSMRPGGGGAPSGRLKAAIESDFGGVAEFRKKFHEAATTLFGSGWVWLVRDKGGLGIVQTANAATPMAEGKTCLLTIDVWEHAYYLDYRNRRADYATAWLDKLVNWEFAEANLG